MARLNRVPPLKLAALSMHRVHGIRGSWLEQKQKRLEQEAREETARQKTLVYICCRNNKNSHENIYSKYILVVALFTFRTLPCAAVP